MKSIGNVFILGDSYSTFEGFIPEGYRTYYSNAGREETDVNKVCQTWWKQVIDETGSALLRNCSYSGTTVCHTGYDGEDCSERSFVARVDRLIKEGFFKRNKVDTFLIFGGTNDTWAGSPVGKLKYHFWTKKDLYKTLPAFCYLLKRVKANAGDARVVVILNDVLKKEISDGFKTACDKYGAMYIALEDINKNCGHPTILGMKQIKEQVLKSL